VAKAGNVAPKPGNVTFEQAAAVPMAGLVAIQDLRDHGKVRPGQRDERYDLILDNVENHSLADCRRALTPDGTLVLNSGTGAAGLGLLVRLIRPILTSPFVKHGLRRYLSSPKREDLEVLTAMVEAGALRPVIDATYPLLEAPAALRYIEAGHARGKVVVSI
jgi:NADPH:quinone reductase-like Zn-dependent oxidoreductase